MTTLMSYWHGPNAANWASLAPGDAKPDEIKVSVQLGDGGTAGTYRGTIEVLYFGTNKKTGEKNSRRTSHRWRFSDHNILLFREGDVRQLLRQRECR